MSDDTPRSAKEPESVGPGTESSAATEDLHDSVTASLGDGVPAPTERLTTSRVEAFSDGVFAIAMTLLILEVRDPGKPRGGLLSGLVHRWPSYASYAVSFVIIGIIWVNHHALFGHVTRVDRPLLYINLLLLLVVAFIPFSHRAARAVLADRWV